LHEWWLRSPETVLTEVWFGADQMEQLFEVASSFSFTIGEYIFSGILLMALFKSAAKNHF
jgi:hypothetical protein